MNSEFGIRNLRKMFVRSVGAGALDGPCVASTWPVYGLTLSLIRRPACGRRRAPLFASLLFCLQNLPPAAFASAKVPAGGRPEAAHWSDTGVGRRAIRESPLRKTKDADCHARPLRPVCALGTSPFRGGKANWPRNDMEDAGRRSDLGIAPYGADARFPDSRGSRFNPSPKATPQLFIIHYSFFTLHRPPSPQISKLQKKHRPVGKDPAGRRFLCCSHSAV